MDYMYYKKKEYYDARSEKYVSEREWRRELWLRYAVFGILLVLVTGVLLILYNFKVSMKTSASVFVRSDSTCVVYVTDDGLFLPMPKVWVEQTECGTVCVKKDSMRYEPGRIVIYGHEVPERKLEPNGYTYSEGYILTGRRYLWDMIFYPDAVY